MPAHVQKAANRAVGLAGHDDRIAAHVGGEKIIRLGQHRLMAQEQPAAGEDALEFQLKCLRIRKNAPVQIAPLHVKYMLKM